MQVAEGGVPGLASGAAMRPGRWLIALGLIAVVMATYANALTNDFVFDDFLLIAGNEAQVRVPLSHGWEGLGYRPLRTLSYRLDYAIGGMNPWIFHLSNVVDHAVTVLLVFLVALLAGASSWAAGAGALVFAVHPVQTDAVTYAAGRRDVLCGLFFVAAFAAYLRHRQGGGWGGMLLVGGAWTLALFTKEMAVTVPLVCWLFARFSRRRPAGEAVPAGRGDRPLVWGGVILVVALLGLALTTYVRFLSRVVAETPWHGGSIGANFATVARIWVHYLGLIVWPARLSVDYSAEAFPVSTSALDPRAWLAAALLAPLAVVGCSAWRRGSLAGFGLAWAAVTVLPVSHVIPYVELLAEHYLYIPMVGVALMVAAVVDAAAASAGAGRRRLVAAAVLVVAAALAGRTVMRNRDFRDGLSLWSATVWAVPDCARARFNLGQVYLSRGRLDDAERTWRAAAARFPQAYPYPLALAKLSYRRGDYARARKDVKRALKLQPDSATARTLAGWISLHGGDPRRAKRYFEAALRNLGDLEDAPSRARETAINDARLGVSSARQALESSDLGARP